MRASAISAPAGLGGRLLDLLRDWRDRLLASARFRRFATAFPPTRPIARRRARALFDLCAGFVYTQVLLACVELRLFDLLAAGPQTAGGLAGRLGLSEAAATRLLEAATALDLVQRRGADAAGRTRYGLGPLGAAVVDNPAVQAMVEHHRLLYADLRDPVALLRGGAGAALSGYWPYAGAEAAGALGAESVGAYTALMAASQPLVAAEVLAAYRLRPHRCLLDVGGGDGSFLRAAAVANPGLRLMLFDLPEVVARARFDAAGVGVTGGDFTRDALPMGADVISLVRVIHDHDDEVALGILRAAARALPPGGTLLLAEPMADAPGAAPVGAAYFGFYLLAMGTGRARSPAELGAMLLQAGFAEWRPVRTRTPLLTGLLVARMPQSSTATPSRM